MKSESPEFTVKELRLMYGLVHHSIIEVQNQLSEVKQEEIETYRVAIAVRDKFRVWAGIEVGANR